MKWETRFVASVPNRELVDPDSSLAKLNEITGSLEGYTVDQILPFLKDKNFRTRIHALTALSKDTNKVENIPYIVELFADENEDIRGWAAASVGRFEDAATGHMIDLFLNEEKPLIVREAAAKTLIDFFQPDSPYIPAIIDALSHPMPNIRAAAITILNGINSPVVIDALARMLHDPETQVREAAAFTLSNKFPQDAIDQWLTALDDPSPEVRGALVFSLRRQEVESAFDKIVQHVNDPDPKVRDDIAYYCVYVGKERSAPYLRAMLSDTDSKVRETAAWGLGSIGDKTALPLLFEFLVTATGKEHYWAASSIAMLGSTKTVRLLITYLLIAEGLERINIAEALAKTKAKAAFRHLVAIFNTAKAQVSNLSTRRVIEAFVEYGDPRAGEYLMSVLDHRSAIVRGAAVRALGELAYSAALPALRLVAQTDSGTDWDGDSISDLATQAIAKIDVQHTDA